MIIKNIKLILNPFFVGHTNISQKLWKNAFKKCSKPLIQSTKRCFTSNTRHIPIIKSGYNDGHFSEIGDITKSLQNFGVATIKSEDFFETTAPIIESGFSSASDMMKLDLVDLKSIHFKNYNGTRGYLGTILFKDISC